MTAVKKKKEGKKRLVPKEEIADEVLKFLIAASELSPERPWVKERDLRRYVTELYKGKISMGTAHNYVDEFICSKHPDISLGKLEEPDGSLLRAVRVIV